MSKIILFQIKYEGLSGRIELDNVGIRSNITVDILLLTENGLEEIGNWTLASDLILHSHQERYPKYVTDDSSLRNQTLRVITALAEPYTMLKDSAEELEGNDRYEGFAIDLIFELSLLMEFSFKFILEEDGNYGVCTNNITNEWNGMIGKVIAEASFTFILLFRL